MFELLECWFYYWCYNCNVLNTEDGNPPSNVTCGYVISVDFHDIWDVADVYGNDGHNVWSGSTNDNIVWIMDGIIMVYLVMGMYLCCITNSYIIGVVVMSTILQLTGLVSFMIYELTTIFIIWLVIIESHTFERSSAVGYMAWFSLTLSFMLICCIDFGIMTLIVMLVGMSKLPVYSLHAWLPKVHVEASLLSSILLAGIVLNMSIVFLGMFGSSVLLVVVGLLSGVVLMFSSDGNVVIAYSSVIHMSLCSMLIGWMGFIVGASHVIISPLIFMAVYCSYMTAGSRLLSPAFGGWYLGVILIVNLGFPLIGAFMSEVYIVLLLGSVMILIFGLQYVSIGVAHVNLFFKINGKYLVETKSWMVIFLLLY